MGSKWRLPPAEARAVVHDIIYRELCQGQVSELSKLRYLRIIEEAVAAGADGVILGCTEIGLLIGQSDLTEPVFDTTALHAAAALDFALSS